MTPHRGRSGVATFRDLAGQHGDDLITLDVTAAGDLCGEPSVAQLNFAHEVAHAWFGGQVRTRSTEAAGWWESLAEYVATSLWDEGGRFQRRDRSHSYAALAPSDEPAAMMEPVRGRAYVPLSYGRGMLLLTALEDRIGKPTMYAMLGHFIRANRGELGSWNAVLASVKAIAGEAHERWLRSWLARVGAPDLKLQGVTVTNGRIRGTIVQTSDPPFAGTVQLGLLKDETRLAIHPIDIASGSTSFDIADVPDARTLVLDPDYRLPRKYDLAKTDEETQRAVTLRGP